jgi:hypothetical protein
MHKANPELVDSLHQFMEGESSAARKAKRNVDTEFQALGPLRRVMKLLKHKSMWYYRSPSR